MKKYMLIGLILVSISQGFAQISPDSILGKWKLIEYEAFEKIKDSPQYVFGTESEINAFDNMAKPLLDKVIYKFSNDAKLNYSDMANFTIIERKADWQIKDSVLFIVETSRPFSREAQILVLSQNELVLIPIIDDAVGSSKMVFRKIE